MALLNGVVGLLVLGYGVVAWRKARLTKGWPSVAGKVLSALCSRYHEGDTVWVLHNPSDPTDAMLEHSGSAASRWIVLGALLAGFALWFAYRAATE